MSLNGLWEIGEGVSPDSPPKNLGHHVPVPGLIHSSNPAFTNVDRFDTPEHVQWMAGTSFQPSPPQSRTYFWYKTHFKAPSRRELAILTLNKAQFGAKVWVNGKLIGEHLDCVGSASLDMTSALRWQGDNTVLIRIGAKPDAVPADIPCGDGDPEKADWTPGIYDDVSAHFSDAIAIESVQVAPKIDPQSIVVQTTVHGGGPAEEVVPVTYTVRDWKTGDIVTTATSSMKVEPGTTTNSVVSIAMPGAKLWSPESPNLYTVETTLPGDHLTTRFGLREFHFDTATKRAYLNGKLYFLRGSNIAFHRFMEDPLSQQLPWNEAWVRKLLGANVKQMHWNFMRFHVGAIPQKWLDIADEEGLLVQYEFPIWGPRRPYTESSLDSAFSGWMKDSWNHPSVVVWDASNETVYPLLGEKVIPAVRRLDLSNRPWDNGYNPPADANDPVEDHPYEFFFLNNVNVRDVMNTGKPPTEWTHKKRPDLDMTALETLNGAGRASYTPPTGHAMVLNEYGWFWLNRDGTPVWTNMNLYDQLPFPHATAAERRQSYAYLLAGMTEYWRAYRNYAAVNYFVYLTANVPGVHTTSDNFSDINTLELDPDFARDVGEAFKPLGVYINFWQPKVPVGGLRNFEVMMINDDPVDSRGTLVLSLEDSQGNIVAKTSSPYDVSTNGQQTYDIQLQLPDASGAYRLEAVATPHDGTQKDSTTSWRSITLIKPTSGATH